MYGSFGYFIISSSQLLPTSYFILTIRSHIHLKSFIVSSPNYLISFFLSTNSFPCNTAHNFCAPLNIISQLFIAIPIQFSYNHFDLSHSYSFFRNCFTYNFSVSGNHSKEFNISNRIVATTRTNDSMGYSSHLVDVL